MGRRKPHCKGTARQIGNNYTQKENCATSVLISTFIYVSVSDLYIPTIGLPYWLQQNILFYSILSGCRAAAAGAGEPRPAGATLRERAGQPGPTLCQSYKAKPQVAISLHLVCYSIIVYDMERLIRNLCK